MPNPVAYILIILLIILLIVVFLAISFIYLPIRLELLLNDSDFIIRIGLHMKNGRLKFAYATSTEDVNQARVDIKREGRGREGFISFIRDTLRDNSGVFRFLREKSILTEYQFSTHTGTGEAFWTGIIFALACAVNGLLISWLSSVYGDFNKKIDIKPNFNQQVFKLHIRCIFKIKIANIIVVILRLYFNSFKKKYADRRWNIWRSTQSKA